MKKLSLIQKIGLALVFLGLSTGVFFSVTQGISLVLLWNVFAAVLGLVAIVVPHVVRQRASRAMETVRIRKDDVSRDSEQSTAKKVLLAFAWPFIWFWKLALSFGALMCKRVADYADNDPAMEEKGSLFRFVLLFVIIGFFLGAMLGLAVLAWNIAHPWVTVPVCFAEAILLFFLIGYSVAIKRNWETYLTRHALFAQFVSKMRVVAEKVASAAFWFVPGALLSTTFWYGVGKPASEDAIGVAVHFIAPVYLALFFYGVWWAWRGPVSVILEQVSDSFVLAVQELSKKPRDIGWKPEDFEYVSDSNTVSLGKTYEYDLRVLKQQAPELFREIEESEFDCHNDLVIHKRKSRINKAIPVGVIVSFLAYILLVIASGQPLRFYQNTLGGVTVAIGFLTTLLLFVPFTRLLKENPQTAASKTSENDAQNASDSLPELSLNPADTLDGPSNERIEEEPIEPQEASFKEDSVVTTAIFLVGASMMIISGAALKGWVSMPLSGGVLSVFAGYFVALCFVLVAMPVRRFKMKVSEEFATSFLDLLDEVCRKVFTFDGDLLEAGRSWKRALQVNFEKHDKRKEKDLFAAMLDYEQMVRGKRALFVAFLVAAVYCLVSVVFGLNPLNTQQFYQLGFAGAAYVPVLTFAFCGVLLVVWFSGPHKRDILEGIGEVQQRPSKSLSVFSEKLNDELEDVVLSLRQRITLLFAGFFFLFEALWRLLEKVAWIFAALYVAVYFVASIVQSGSGWWHAFRVFIFANNSYFLVGILIALSAVFLYRSLGLFVARLRKRHESESSKGKASTFSSTTGKAHSFSGWLAMYDEKGPTYCIEKAEELGLEEAPNYRPGDDERRNWAALYLSYLLKTKARMTFHDWQDLYNEMDEQYCTWFGGYYDLIKVHVVVHGMTLEEWESLYEDYQQTFEKEDDSFPQEHVETSAVARNRAVVALVAAFVALIVLPWAYVSILGPGKQKSDVVAAVQNSPSSSEPSAVELARYNKKVADLQAQLRVEKQRSDVAKSIFQKLMRACKVNATAVHSQPGKNRLYRKFIACIRKEQAGARRKRLLAQLQKAERTLERSQKVSIRLKRASQRLQRKFDALGKKYAQAQRKAQKKDTDIRALRRVTKRYLAELRKLRRSKKHLIALDKRFDKLKRDYRSMRDRLGEVRRTSDKNKRTITRLESKLSRRQERIAQLKRQIAKPRRRVARAKLRKRFRRKRKRSRKARRKRSRRRYFRAVDVAW